MKKIVIAILLLCGSSAHSQELRRLTFAVLVGTGIDLSRPASTPLTGQIIARYHFNSRFSVGGGTGISLYEKPLIPLFAEAKVNICKPKRWTPSIRCGAGYGFAASDEANGGIHLHPAVGVSWAVHQRMKLVVQAGYELQKLERLKRYANDMISAEFVERLSHHMISFKIGVEF